MGTGGDVELRPEAAALEVKSDGAKENLMVIDRKVCASQETHTS